MRRDRAGSGDTHLVRTGDDAREGVLALALALDHGLDDAGVVGAQIHEAVAHACAPQRLEEGGRRGVHGGGARSFCSISQIKARSAVSGGVMVLSHNFDYKDCCWPCRCQGSWKEGGAPMVFEEKLRGAAASAESAGSAGAMRVPQWVPAGLACGGGPLGASSSEVLRTPAVRMTSASVGAHADRGAIWRGARQRDRPDTLGIFHIYISVCGIRARCPGKRLQGVWKSGVNVRDALWGKKNPLYRDIRHLYPGPLETANTWRTPGTEQEANHCLQLTELSGFVKTRLLVRPPACPPCPAGRGPDCLSRDKPSRAPTPADPRSQYSVSGKRVVFVPAGLLGARRTRTCVAPPARPYVGDAIESIVGTASGGR